MVPTAGCGMKNGRGGEVKVGTREGMSEGCEEGRACSMGGGVWGWEKYYRIMGEGREGVDKYNE